MSRRHPWIELSAEALANYVAPAFGRHTIEAVAPLSGGLCNTNYRFTVNQVRYVLRLYTHDPDAGARDMTLAHRLPAEVPRPAILYADATAHPWPYAILDFIDGQPLTRDSATTGRSVGRALAALQQMSFDRYGFLDASLKVRPWADGVQGYMTYVLECLPGTAAQQLGTDLSSQVEAFVATHRTRLDDLPGPTLCHGDFNKRNLLMDADGHLVAVLDWEFAHAGLPLSDVANLFRYGSSPQFERGFLEGYTPLPKDWRWLGRLIDLANLVEALSRVRDPSIIAELRGLIEATLTRETQVPPHPAPPDCQEPGPKCGQKPSP